ncbi:HlyD family secretion protein [Solimonas marina]|uniref:HlyD family efflux transporter periplasmic adaptor subunit n=1 Tax=Solimonas marina TaxID=2714601 RepID=A0A969W9M5_9GAMM|nr:HlyD family efflux transporter periplasmic adaptor subunit [Solimonas marina]NKF22543.1 HlyD family efflux transporter periplasmic adaptor subunit [Solimonas marina]
MTRLGAGLLIVALLGGCHAADSTYQGYVEAEFVDVASSQAGRLETLSVRRGDQVPAQAPLFALDAQPERAQQQQAAQQLAAAQAQLADLQTGKRPPEVAAVRAQLAEAQATARNAATLRARDEALIGSGAISQAQFDASRAADDESAARVRQLQNELTVASLPGRAQQLAALSAQVEAARAALDQANWRLSEKTMSALRAGRVYDTLYRAGEWVAAGSPVVRLLPADHIKIRFFVPESVVGALHAGQTVTLHCDGCAKPVAATIRYVSSQAEYTPPVIYSNETRAKLVFMVEAWPAPADAAALHPGQPVSVTRP